MAFKKRFPVSDESINSKGFWVRSAGGKLEQANKNCPAYFMHRTWEIPLGHWEDIKLEADNVIWATLVIDGAGYVEKEYIRKIENGDIKGASIGADPLTWSDELLYVKQGQTVATLWDWELYEISLAPLPGNKNAIALKNAASLVTLSDESSTEFLPSLKTKPKMKRIALALGLKEDATEDVILVELSKVQNNAANADAMRGHLEAIGKDAIADEAAKELFVELTKSDFGSAVKLMKLHAKPAPAPAVEAPAAESKVKVTELIKKGTGAPAAEDAKDSFDYLQKHNAVELARIHKEEPAKYKELATGYKNGIRYKG